MKMINYLHPDNSQRDRIADKLSPDCAATIGQKTNWNSAHHEPRQTSLHQILRYRLTLCERLSG